MDNCEIIANRIKEVLRKKGVTSKKMLNDLGLNINYIAQMKMAISPQIGNLTRIADYLNVPLDYLLYGTQPSPAQNSREAELIRLVSEMTDEQRESLLVLLRAMQDGKN